MAEIRIVHQDDHLVVVDKPPAVLVTAAPGRRTPTLIDLLSRQLGSRVLPVHRLDEGTTGALVVALTEAARAAMDELFRQHALLRDYLTLVIGRPSPPAGRIESKLLESGGVVRVAERGGQLAITHYESLERRGRATLVRCRLETGRRNQIRVHMQALGCPVAGDRKYGYRSRQGENYSRPMLHSWRLSFRHPLSPVDVAVEVEPPERELRP